MEVIGLKITMAGIENSAVGPDSGFKGAKGVRLSGQKLLEKGQTESQSTAKTHKEGHGPETKDPDL